MASTTANSSKVNQADRCRDVGLAMGWLHPFFLIPLSYLKFEEVKDTKECPTMAVFHTGRVIINPQWAAGVGDKELAGAVCHEIMHLILQHHGRVGSRDKFKWNIAGDLAINGALREMSIPLPAGALFPPAGGELLTAEEWYEKLPDTQKIKATGAVGAGCGVEKDPQAGSGEGDEDGEGKSGGGDQEGKDGAGKTPGNTPGPAVDWEVVAHQAQAAARGTASAQALAPLLKPKEAGVRWRQILRSTMNRVAANGGRDMQTMTRRNRRSPDGFVLPGWISHRPTVAVVIDSSGSMSDAMLEKAVAEAKAAGEAAGCRVFLALHDARCYWHGWIDMKGPPDKLGRLMTHRGGTDAEEAYKVVGKERARFDTLIHLTDGELGRWPEIPDNTRRLVAAIVGESRYHSQPPAGSTLIKVAIDER